MNRLIKFCFIALFVIATTGPLFAFGQRELPLPPEPAPANMATMADIESLRNEVIRLNDQVLALQAYCLGIDEYCAKLENMLLTVARANSFDEVRRLLKERFGITVDAAYIQDMQAEFTRRIAGIKEIRGIVDLQKANIKNIRKIVKPTPKPR